MPHPTALRGPAVAPSTPRETPVFGVIRSRPQVCWGVQVVQVPPRTLGQITTNWVIKTVDTTLIGHDRVGHGWDIAPTPGPQARILSHRGVSDGGLGPPIRKLKSWDRVTAIGLRLMGTKHVLRRARRRPAHRSGRPIRLAQLVRLNNPATPAGGTSPSKPSSPPTRLTSIPGERLWGSLALGGELPGRPFPLNR
jgi:hypothetical protein